MDSLDLQLLRAHFVEEAYTLRGIVPGCSVLGLSRKVGASRITVARRLARWRSDGFGKGTVAYPNADALGARFQLQPLLLENPRNRDRFETAIREELEPLLGFQIEGFYGALGLTDTPQKAVRRRRAFERASGSKITLPSFEVPFPKSEMLLSGRDWRVLRALRRLTDPDWVQVASEVGMTVRGLERRVKRLMGANALFFQPLVDFRRLPVSIAWVGLRYERTVEPQELWNLLKERHPDVLRVEPSVPAELFRPGATHAPTGGALTFFLSVPSGSSGDALRRELDQLPGATDVVVGFPTQNMTAPRGLDSRITQVSERGGRRR